jgi:ATP-dependent Clp protease ATP-binding subunit ClpC
VDFKNVILIMTSNLGSAHLLKRAPGFSTGEKEQEEEDAKKNAHEVAMKELRRAFRPEFLNRLDEIILFDPLSEDQLLEITRLMIGQLNDSLEPKSVQITVTEEAYAWLVDNTCKDRSYGARPLRRAIQKHIEDALSERLIQRRFQGECQVEIFLENDRLGFRDREVQETNPAR